MKYLPLIFLMVGFSVWAQPNVCISPPAPYERGGDFQFIIIQADGTAVYGDDIDNKLCVGSSPVSVGLINANQLNPKTHRYLLDVKDDIFVPKPSEFDLQEIFTVSQSNTGDYWVMQIEERNGKLMLSCKSLEIRAPSIPQALSDQVASVNDQGKPVVFSDKVPVPGQDFALFLQPGEVLLDVQALPFWEVDQVDATQESRCFSARYQGDCQIVSEISTPVCTPFVEVKRESLVWEIPAVGEDWEIIGYQIVQVLAGGRKEVLNRVKTNTIPLNLIQGERPRLIQVEVLLENLRSKNQESSFSNIVEVSSVGQLYFPTAFTPNQDGTNDIWQPVMGSLPSKMKLTILNRQNEVIFFASEPSHAGWDGTIQGKMAPAGVYPFIIEYEIIPGIPKQHHGQITLVR